MGNFNLKKTQLFDIKGKMGVVSHICIYNINKNYENFRIFSLPCTFLKSSSPNTLSLGTDRLQKFLEFFLTVYMYHGAHCPWGELSVGRNVRGAKCPWGEMSVERDIRGAKCPWGEMSMGRIVHGAKCPWGEISVG